MIFAMIIDCGIANCVVCNVRDRRCIQCKERYYLSSDNECKGEYLVIIIIISLVYR